MSRSHIDLLIGIIGHDSFVRLLQVGNSMWVRGMIAWDAYVETTEAILGFAVQRMLPSLVAVYRAELEDPNATQVFWSEPVTVLNRPKVCIHMRKANRDFVIQGGLEDYEAEWLLQVLNGGACRINHIAYGELQARKEEAE